MVSKVLIVDDEPDIRELLEITLGRMSLTTASAENVEGAMSLLMEQEFSLCLTDMRLPDGNGIDLVEHIQQNFSDMPVAVITAHGSTETAIRALKAGAFDFVSKPVDLQKLRELVRSAIKLSEPTAVGEKNVEASSETSHSGIDGNSESIQLLRQQIQRLARSQAPIFISGASGSGKELVARAIHNQSSRRNSPFIAVNCGAIPGELVESELFGHLKGSFTGADQDKQGLFQAANEGSLFLDEVADLPLHTQVKLLRVIQEKSIRPIGSQDELRVDVRLLSATHKDLKVEVDKGRLRQDLFFRINVIELQVPSLKQRIEDLPLLVNSILQKIANENRTTAHNISNDAMNLLKKYDFPGNVRELENILQRATTLSENYEIRSENLDFISTSIDRKKEREETVAVEASTEMEPASTAQQEFALDDDFSLEKHLESIEKEAIEQALRETRWNRTAAAKKLGMSFRSLRYRLKKLGLD